MRDLGALCALRVRVVENPLIAGQIRAVAVDGHDALADDFDILRAVLI